MALQHPWLAIDASRDSDHVSRDSYHCISGWRSMHPRMATIASRDGALEMTIDASRDGNRSIPGWLSFHPRMAMDASWDGYRCILGWRSIERLRLTSPAVKQPKRPSLYSVSLIRLHGKKAVISTVISETQAARNLRSTTVSTITIAQLPCRLDRAATRPRVQVSY